MSGHLIGCVLLNKSRLMLISATSALVLFWTSPDIWSTDNARKYFEQLDLSEGKPLYDAFEPLENYMLTEGISNRKYFVRKHVLAFLAESEKENKNGQVIVLAAGIAPLSAEIATLFPKCTVFDVDKYAMPEKEKYLKKVCRNIEFIACDITRLDLLKIKLMQSGWDVGAPTIVVIEGIIYYLTEEDLKKILVFFAGQYARLILDFVLKPECVNEKNRRFGVIAFDKIREWVGLEFLNFYEPDYFMTMVETCGFKNAKRYIMDGIQLERTGKKDPFDFKEPSWVSMVKN
jgi:hypothetical protein